MKSLSVTAITQILSEQHRSQEDLKLKREANQIARQALLHSWLAIGISFAFGIAMLLVAFLI